MSIKFQQFAVVNGAHKCRAHYSAGVIKAVGGVEQAVVTVYARDYGHELAAVFEGVEGVGYENNTDSQTDYFEKSRVRIPAGHALYEAALARAEANEAKAEAKAALRRSIHAGVIDAVRASLKK